MSDITEYKETKDTKDTGVADAPSGPGSLSEARIEPGVPTAAMLATPSQAGTEQSMGREIRPIGEQVKPVVRRGPAPFWNLLTFVMRDFFRSPWPLMNVAVLVAVHSLFFNYRSSQGHFFAIEYVMVVVIAALTTASMFARANRAETYAILARPVRRVTLTSAILLASWLVAALFHLISTLIEGIRFSLWLSSGVDAIPWRNPATYLNGTLPVLVAAAAAVGLIAVLSAFVSSSGVRLGVLGALALLVMSFDSKNFPFPAARPFLQQLPPVLAPAAGALKFATDTPPDRIATASLELLAIYALFLLSAALWLSSSRESILD